MTSETKSLFDEFAEDCEKIYKMLEEELKKDIPDDELRNRILEDGRKLYEEIVEKHIMENMVCSKDLPGNRKIIIKEIESGIATIDIE